MSPRVAFHISVSRKPRQSHRPCPERLAGWGVCGLQAPSPVGTCARLPRPQPVGALREAAGTQAEVAGPAGAVWDYEPWDHVVCLRWVISLDS